MTIKQMIKRVVKTVFLFIAAPLYLIFLTLTLVSQEDSVFQGFSQALSLIPGKIGTYLRAAFYRLACPGTSDEISVGFLTILSHRDTTIQKGVYIGPQCNIGKCIICENTLLGSGVHILSGNKQHSFRDINIPIQQQGGVYRKVKIECDCWIGNASIIMSDINKRSIIASGSIITKALVETDGIYAGQPAKLVRKRTDI